MTFLLKPFHTNKYTMNCIYWYNSILRHFHAGFTINTNNAKFWRENTSPLISLISIADASERNVNICVGGLWLQGCALQQLLTARHFEISAWSKWVYAGVIEGEASLYLTRGWQFMQILHGKLRHHVKNVTLQLTLLL